MDVLVKSHAAAARVAAGIDAMLALRQAHGFSGDDIASMHLGIPKVIQGRLTNPHPVDLQAAQMCLPFSVALASHCPARGRPHPDAGGRRLRGGLARSPPVRHRGAHHDCARRRGGGGEQRALHRRQGERAPARRARRSSKFVAAPKGSAGDPFTARGARGALHAGAVEPRLRTRSAPRSSRCRRTSTGSIRAGSGSCSRRPSSDARWHSQSTNCDPLAACCSGMNGARAN